MVIPQKIKRSSIVDASLRTKFEDTFGLLKKDSKYLKSYHHFPNQVDIILVCIIFHNYVLVANPKYCILQKVTIDEYDTSSFSTSVTSLEKTHVCDNINNIWSNSMGYHGVTNYRRYRGSVLRGLIRNYVSRLYFSL